MPDPADLTYEDVRPFDWGQLRAFLWDVLPRGGDGEVDWGRAAVEVNRRSPGAAAVDADDCRRIAERLRPLLDGEGASGWPNAWARLLYSQAGRLFRGHTRFMNLGYAPGPPEAHELTPADRPYLPFIRLYHHLLSQVDLSGRDILEVGCGGGGGVKYAATAFSTRSATGLDLLASNIRECLSETVPTGTRFEVGGAHALPFAPESFDVVLSLESSHSYPDLDRFFREARRVLRVGGAFLLADLRPTDDEWGPGRDMSALRKAIDRGGFAIQREQDITGNVLEAMSELDPIKRMLLESLAATPSIRAHFSEILLCEGSANHARLRSRGWEYRSFVLARP